MREIVPGVWRWTAPHPAWRADAPLDSPDDWERDVGCVLHVTPGAAVWIDPLLPADAATFWRQADALMGDRPVSVLTTLPPHRRSREVFIERYRAATEPPDGVQALPFPAADETMVWLAAPRALVPGDRILGGRDGEGLRLCPESWLRWLKPPLSHDGLRIVLHPLTELPVQHVIVSHGEPAIGGGAAALAELLGQGR